MVTKHLIFLVFTEALFFLRVSGHGYMLDPPNRSSIWREDWSQLKDYEDNQYFCGGRESQYDKNGGKCGECGDDYADPKPRANENGGKFGQGLIVRNYSSGSVVEVEVTLTANHLGTFHYSLCDLSPNPNLPEEETCFQDLKLSDGSAAYEVSDTQYEGIKNLVQLPKGLTCQHCVLRWHYRTGNSWGVCDNGVSGIGCGNQEIFRSCADIGIY